MTDLKDLASRVSGWHMTRLRNSAVRAVTECEETIFGDDKGMPPPEGPFNAMGYRYVIANPSVFFMCASCVDSGPWHKSWVETRLRKKALGPCCTGAD